MYPKIIHTIAHFSSDTIPEHRKKILQALVDFIKEKRKSNETVRLNFICTHNSRRSHLCQRWAQAMAHYFGVNDVFCYSGGTEVTAVFPKIVETLQHQGFEVMKLSETENPVYAIKSHSNQTPSICFSKEYHHFFNPKNSFAAILTCNNADETCPTVTGTEKRIAITYQDPKIFDNSEIMNEKYAERSLEIAQEMWYVFSEASIL